MEHFDTAIRGNSALRATLLRKFLDELHCIGEELSVSYLEQFYDSIDVVKLVET